MEVIARTEVLRAHNLGKLKFHQAVGIQRLEWFTMEDERVCPVCGPLDGKSFPLDQFPQQPAHPQCRCGHYPAWPLVVCGQGLLAASAAPSAGDACILPPQSIEGMAAAQAEEQKTLKAAFESGDPAKLGALTLKQIQTLAKGQGVAIARTKADFLKLLADKGVDATGVSGKALEALLKQHGNRLPQDDAAYKQLMRQLDQRNAPITERVERMVQYWNGRLGVEDVRKLPRYNPAGVYQYDTRRRRAGDPIGYRRSERFDLDVGKEMRGYRAWRR